MITDYYYCYYVRSCHINIFLVFLSCNGIYCIKMMMMMGNYFYVWQRMNCKYNGNRWILLFTSLISLVYVVYFLFRARSFQGINGTYEWMEKGTRWWMSCISVIFMLISLLLLSNTKFDKNLVYENNRIN